MTRDEIDIMWQKAMQEAVEDGEMYTRYRFARVLADAEREACAKICEDLHPGLATRVAAEHIRARGQA